MKHTVKKLFSLLLCLILLTACLAGLGITASAEDDVLEISGLGDWMSFMMDGGHARLTDDLEVDLLGTMKSAQNGTYLLDLCGHSLSCTRHASINADISFICVSSGAPGSFSLNQGFSNSGTFALMNTALCLNSEDDPFRSFSDNNGTMILYDTALSINGDAELYSDGTVMYLELDGGEITSDEFPEFVSGPYGFVPTRSGYNFCGWTYDGGKQIIDFSDLHGEVTVSATWAAASTVTFDALGGVCNTETLQPGGRYLTLPNLPTATKDGVCFDGWCMPDGSKVTTNTVFTEDTTVTACWIPEADRADELAAEMAALGFSQSRIDDFTEQLTDDSGSSSAASLFLPPNVWVFVGLAVIIAAAAVLTVVLVRRRSSGKM